MELVVSNLGRKSVLSADGLRDFIIDLAEGGREVLDAQPKDGWTDEWINDWMMDEYMDGYMDTWMDECMDQLMDGWMDG